MAIPRGYRRIEGSECRAHPEARRVGLEEADKPLSATIRVKRGVGQTGRDRVVEFATARGLRPNSTGEADEIVISGTVAQINAAFGIQLGLYAWRGEAYRGYEGFPSLPAEMGELVAEVIGLIERGTGDDSPWIVPRRPSAEKPDGGSSQDGTETIQVIADWVVPKRGPRPCENMISDAGIAQQRWLAPAGARGQAAIACISGLAPKILIIRFILSASTHGAGRQRLLQRRRGAGLRGHGHSTCLPKTQTSGNAKRGLFIVADFIYDAENDRYTCPAGEHLTKGKVRSDRRHNIDHYRNLTACLTCALEKSEELQALRAIRNMRLAHSQDPNRPDPRRRSDVRKAVNEDEPRLIEATVLIVQQLHSLIGSPGPMDYRAQREAWRGRAEAFWKAVAARDVGDLPVGSRRHVGTS
jgi:hypothetical protein